VFCVFIATSCGANTDNNTNQEVGSSDPIEQELIIDGADAGRDEGADNESEEKIFAEFGTAYVLGDWEVTVNSVEFISKIPMSYLAFDAGDGNVYAVINATVTNKGKESAQFQESFAFGEWVDIKLLYDNDYEYSPVNLLGYDNSFDNISIPALSTKTANIVIKTPELIQNDKNNAEIIFSYSRSRIIYKIP
jgi:hypothetical protein